MMNAREMKIGVACAIVISLCSFGVNRAHSESLAGESHSGVIKAEANKISYENRSEGFIVAYLAEQNRSVASR